jgi:hypothetical protein
MSGHKKSFLRDNRGATAFMFLAASSAFLAAAGLAMEGGTWYVERRHGQSVADSAAIAGVMNLGKPATNGSALAVAVANGYSAAEVQVANPPTSGPYIGNSNAVMVTVTRQLPRSFTALLMGAGNTTVAEVATAVKLSTGNACSLALDGGLSFQGAANVSAPDCVLASNRTGSDAISFIGTGNSTNKTQVSNAILVGQGGCYENGSGTPCEAPGNLMYQPAAYDPYAVVQSDPFPSAVNATNCKNTATATSPYVISSGSYPVYCVGADLNLNGSGSSVTLTNNGTYYFYDASIAVTSGSLTCSSCTIIFTGSTAAKMGKLSINGGTVSLSAIKSPPLVTGGVNANGVSDYAGLLFYMDARYSEYSNACGSAQVSIQGSSNVTLNGALYFPNASVCVSGNGFSTSEKCLALTGYSIEFNGSATETVSGCDATGTSVAQVEAITLVQ